MRPPEYPGDNACEYNEGSRRCVQDGRFQLTDLKPRIYTTFGDRGIT